MIYRIKKYLNNLSHRSKFIKKAYNIANILKVRILSPLSDEKYIKLKAKENLVQRINLDNPTTFNDKLFKKGSNKNKVLLDVKSILDRKEFENAGYNYWRL